MRPEAPAPRLAAWLALLLPAAFPGGGHPPPTAHVELTVRADRVDFDVIAELQVWNAWLGLQVSGEYLLSEADCAAIGAAASELFATRNRVSVAGEAVAPRLLGVVPPTDFVPGRTIPDVRVRFELTTSAPARTVALHWETFEATDWFERPAVPVMIRHAGDVEEAVLTPAEPEHIWRAPLRPPPRVVVDEVRGEPASAPRSLPLASLALCAAGVVVASLRRRLRPTLRWGALAAALALAVAVRGHLRLPLGGGIRVPDPPAALELFRRLHTNVYRAFSAHTDEEIYDLLAVSVAPAILDQMYTDVYESLVLRGQGGARCVVDRIEPIDAAVIPGPDDVTAPHFAVDFTWRVHGRVSHWGHEHYRINRYRAEYLVEHDGRSWRIARVRVLEQERVERDG